MFMSSNPVDHGLICGPNRNPVSAVDPDERVKAAKWRRELRPLNLLHNGSESPVLMENEDDNIWSLLVPRSLQPVAAPARNRETDSARNESYSAR
ncbi:hypothetical protein TNCV_4795261 [Trichonephila clavipes]|nr:hypothetical protein TNCV_4795261 [Trichonephila clavipes]